MRSDFSLKTVAISLTLTNFLVPNKKNGFSPFSYKFFVPIWSDGLYFFFGVFLPQPTSCFSEPAIFRNLYHIFLPSVGLSLGLFLFYRYFFVPHFGLACDHGNSFLCLEE